MDNKPVRPAELAQAGDAPGQNPKASLAELLQQLISYEGPPQGFLIEWVRVQCVLTSATAGAVLRLGTPDEQGKAQAELLAVYPQFQQGQMTPSWLARAAEAIHNNPPKQPTILPMLGESQMYGQTPEKHLLLMPLPQMSSLTATAAFEINGDELVAEIAAKTLATSAVFFQLYETKIASQQREKSFKQMRSSMETFAAVQQEKKFHAAAMAFCNEIATKMNFERVGLGVLKAKYVNLIALDHTEKFSRKMQLVQQLESAMEECLDQDLETGYPAPENSIFVNRAAAELVRKQGSAQAAFLPIRRHGHVVMVLSIEAAAENPINPENLEVLRLICEMCAAVLFERYLRDRWVGARVGHAVRDGLAWVVGAKHTWAKLIAILVLCVIIFALFFKGDYEVEAPIIIESEEQQVLAAPFEGYLMKVNSKPGDLVKKDQTVLGILDDSELIMRIASQKGELASFNAKADKAMQEGDVAQARIEQAQAKKVQAQIRLLEHRLNKVKLVAPKTGYVVSNDLRKQMGMSVKQGDVLFEIAAIDSLRATIKVPEGEVPDVSQGQPGELAITAHPDKRIKFVVERVQPIAQVSEKDKDNIFEVWVKLEDPPKWLRPGMEGEGRIYIGQRRYIWLWSHRLIDWIRMKLWI